MAINKSYSDVYLQHRQSTISNKTSNMQYLAFYWQNEPAIHYFLLSIASQCSHTEQRTEM